MAPLILIPDILVASSDRYWP